MWHKVVEVPVAGVACGLLTLMVWIFFSIAGDSTRATVAAALLRVAIASPLPPSPLLPPAPPRSLLVIPRGVALV